MRRRQACFPRASKRVRKLEEDVAFRVLAAGNFPRHQTLCDFRKQRLHTFKALFIQVVQIAREAELVKPVRSQRMAPWFRPMP